MKYVTDTYTYNYSLAAGTSYAYRVRAVSGETSSEFSGSVSLTIARVPGQVTGVKLEGSGTKNVSITWEPVALADYYELYRNVGGSGWAKVKNVQGSSTLNYSLTAGVEYKYRLRAVREVSQLYKAYGAWSEDKNFTLGTGATAPAKVSGLAAVQSGTKNVSLAWDEVMGAEYYELWRKVGEADWAKVKNVSGTETLNYSLSAGVEYGYKVRAVKDGLYGAFSEPVFFSLANAPAQVTGVKATQSGTKNVYLEWEAVSGAEYYELWRKVGDADWAKVKNVTGATSTYNYTLIAGVQYGYKLRAAANGLYGAFSEEVYFSLTGAPAQVTGVKATQNGPKNVLIEWDAVAGAEYYELWRMVGDADWAKVKNVREATSTYNYSLSEGIVYGYKLRAVANGLYGAFSEPVHFYLVGAPAQVTGVKTTQDGTKNVLIEWNPTDGAEYYELWRKVGEADWAKVKDVKGAASTYNYSLSMDVEYGYKLRAVANGLYGAFSEPVYFSLGIPPAQVTGLRASQNTASHVYLSWNAVADAEYYEVWRNENGADWAKILNVTRGTGTLNSLLSLGVNYGYKVRAVKGGLCGAFSEPVYFSLASAPGPVTGLKVQATSDTDVLISWNHVFNSNYYELSYAEGSGEYSDALQVTGSGSTNSTTISGLTTGSCYTFRMRAAWVHYTGHKAYGEYATASVIVAAPPAQVTGLNAVAEDNRVELSWSSAANAEEYEIEQRFGTKWKKVATQSETSTTISNLVYYTTYDFRVRGRRSDGFGGYRYGPYSDVVNITINPLPGQDPYNLMDETYSFENYGDSDSAGGHCFGMSATSSGYHIRVLDLSIIGGNANSRLYDFSETSIVKAPICHYQAIQGSYATRAIVAGGSVYLYGNNDITSDWQQVVDYVKDHSYDYKGLLQIGYRKGQGGHAINFLRYENVDGQDRIYVYDNNFPTIETYFYKDSSGDVRQAPKQTFSGAIDCISLRDVRTYFSIAGGYDASRVLYMTEENAAVQGYNYSLMEGSDDVMYEIPDGEDSVIIIPNKDHASFTYMGEEYSFGEITEATRGKLMLTSSKEQAKSSGARFEIFEDETVS